MSSASRREVAGAGMSPWRGAGNQLLIAGGAYVAIGIAAYLTAGPAALAVVSVVAAAIALTATRLLLPERDPETTRTIREKPAAQSISGYSRRRFVVQHASATPEFYEAELRPVLEHILAARLAERREINLYSDPRAAHAALGDQLWYWIDPDDAAGRRERGSGIPPRKLARLLDRLERL